jgi:endonuclease YncB( thermonuclease family)
MIKTHILATLALALVLTACKQADPPLKAEPLPSITGHVRVLDADVLIIDGQHLRLANAYGPESLLHARCWAESIAADHAAEYVRQLVDRAATYAFELNGKTDDYGRKYATVSIDGADLGDILYGQGLASRPSIPRFDWCQPISQKAEGAPKISSLYNPS